MDDYPEEYQQAKNLTLQERGYVQAGEWKEDGFIYTLFLHPTVAVPVVRRCAEQAQPTFTHFFQINRTLHDEYHTLVGAEPADYPLANGDHILECYMQVDSDIVSDADWDHAWEKNVFSPQWLAPSQLFSEFYPSALMDKVTDKIVTHTGVDRESDTITADARGLEELMRASHQDYRKVEEFLVTDTGTNQRFWKQSVEGRPMSYRTEDIEIARHRAKLETRLMQIGADIGAVMLQRDSREFDSTGLLTFQLERAGKLEPHALAFNEEGDKIDLLDLDQSRSPIVQTFPCDHIIRQPKDQQTLQSPDLDLV